VRREFLGDARCFVLEVKPSRAGRDGFSGRIWVDDRDYTIVRFNGINRSVDQTLSTFFRRTLSFHVDGWRINVMPGVWLPSYVYCEETDLSDVRSTGGKARFKSQVRVWGYEAQAAEDMRESTTIASTRRRSSMGRRPPASCRRLSASGVGAGGRGERRRAARESWPACAARRGRYRARYGDEQPHGDKRHHPRTAVAVPHSAHVPLESFTVGHTVVLSRGLIDVLPDEGSLATMLAHELSHVVLVIR